MRKELGPVQEPKRWRRRGYLTEKELREIARSEADAWDERRREAAS